MSTNTYSIYVDGAAPNNQGGCMKGGIIYSDSELCVKGYNEWLDGWKAKGWCKADKKPVAYRELWQQVDTLRKISM